jgi:hypothetical protein
MRFPSLCAVLAIALPLSCPTRPLGTTPKSSLCDSADRLPGKYLKWIIIAEPVFRHNHLDLNRYNIMVEEVKDQETGKDAIAIGLIATDETCEGRGSTGSVPNFEVRIDKNNGKVLGSYYER